MKAISAVAAPCPSLHCRVSTEASRATTDRPLPEAQPLSPSPRRQPLPIPRPSTLPACSIPLRRDAGRLFWVPSAVRPGTAATKGIFRRGHVERKSEHLLLRGHPLSLVKGPVQITVSSRWSSVFFQTSVICRTARCSPSNFRRPTLSPSSAAPGREGRVRECRITCHLSGGRELGNTQSVKGRVVTQ